MWLPVHGAAGLTYAPSFVDVPAPKATLPPLPAVPAVPAAPAASEASPSSNGSSNGKPSSSAASTSKVSATFMSMDEDDMNTDQLACRCGRNAYCAAFHVVHGLHVLCGVQLTPT